MNQKLIKISDTHYIVSDDSEIKEGDFYLDRSTGNNYVKKMMYPKWGSEPINCFKITHSTQPLEYIEHKDEFGTHHIEEFDKIKPLFLSEVEEAIYGYNVEEMAEQFVIEKVKMSSQSAGVMVGYIEGFNAHRELVKDKFILSKEQIFELIEKSQRAILDSSKIGTPIVTKNEIIQSLLPKTEWDVTFKNGKLELL